MVHASSQHHQTPFTKTDIFTLLHTGVAGLLPPLLQLFGIFVLNVDFFGFIKIQKVHSDTNKVNNQAWGRPTTPASEFKNYSFCQWGLVSFHLRLLAAVSVFFKKASSFVIKKVLCLSVFVSDHFNEVVKLLDGQSEPVRDTKNTASLPVYGYWVINLESVLYLQLKNDVPVLKAAEFTFSLHMYPVFYHKLNANHVAWRIISVVRTLTSISAIINSQFIDSTCTITRPWTCFVTGDLTGVPLFSPIHTFGRLKAPSEHPSFSFVSFCFVSIYFDILTYSSKHLTEPNVP